MNTLVKFIFYTYYLGFCINRTAWPSSWNFNPHKGAVAVSILAISTIMPFVILCESLYSYKTPSYVVFIAVIMLHSIVVYLFLVRKIHGNFFETLRGMTHKDLLKFKTKYYLLLSGILLFLLLTIQHSRNSIAS